MSIVLISNALVVNEGNIEKKDVLIKGHRIHAIGNNLSHPHDLKIEAKGLYMLPGWIDDQVHFREPGLTHKADIRSESRAAVAGGITSFMEMPNTSPPALTQELLQEKYQLAGRDSMANYSFYMGVSNDNSQEVLKTPIDTVCGIKIFMGSSTGNMLVDNLNTLEKLFSEIEMPIAVHCEDEDTIRKNLASYQKEYGDDIPWRFHPEIRNSEACYKSSSFAVELAQRHGTRLHVLHISTAKETDLFHNNEPLENKKITAEACIHHLWFSDRDYFNRGAYIKWNPAVKSAEDRETIWKAVLDGRIDVLATDHAPHTLEEKGQPYTRCPSGGPLVQHALPALLECYHQGKITLEMIGQKISHNPAILFNIKERGFIREGYFADLVLVDLDRPWTVHDHNILYKCGWSPFSNITFRSRIVHTLVSGQLAYSQGTFDESVRGQRLGFNR